MPAPKTEPDESPEAAIIAEPLSLDDSALGDGEGDGEGDYSALSLPQDLDLVSFQAELELDNINADDGGLGDEYAGDVISEETVECVEIDGTVDHEEYLYEEEESILPELEDPGLTLAEDNVETMTITPSGMLRQTQLSQPLEVASSLPQGQSIVLIKSSGASNMPSLSSHIAVTVSGGRIVSSGSIQQIQHKLITTKSTGGSIVQLLPANLHKPIMATGVASNVQSVRPLQSALKRPATSTVGPTRNVYAKVVLSGSQSMQQGQPIMLASTQSGETSGQPVKIISSGHPSRGGTTRAITLAQAQQMGLISPSMSPAKLGLQQILPSSPKQGGNIVVSKIMGSPAKGHPTKITMMQASSLKSPTKILPAPSGISQLKAVSSAMVTGATTVHTAVRTAQGQQQQQKVIIRQGPLKPGSVLSPGVQGQVIRIPSSHNLLGAGGNVAQIQMPGSRQVQYVRLVTASGSNASTVTTTSRPRMVPVSTLSAGGVRPVAITSVRSVSSGQPVKVVPIAPATSNVRLGSPKTMQVQAQVGQRILIPSSASQIRTITTASGQSILPSGARNITYMLPTQYVQQAQSKSQLQSPASLPSSVISGSPPTSVSQAAGSLIPSPPEPAVQPRLQSAAARLSIEANGLRPRKPCNCTKSQCLKLYCDCFANGEFCYMCNCNNCFNNLQHEEDRQIAIKSCLERNNNAFRPKIGKGHVGDERRHNKGCNCKRSGCLKNYCECYEAKISCSNNCKCVGCRNVEEGCQLDSLRDLADAAESRYVLEGAGRVSRKEQSSPSFDKASRIQPGHVGTKPQFNFVTSAVVAATVECLAAIAEEAEANNLNDTDSERLMLEEFGRCLKEVISISDRADAALLENGKTLAAIPQATVPA